MLTKEKLQEIIKRRNEIEEKQAEIKELYKACLVEQGSIVTQFIVEEKLLENTYWEIRYGSQTVYLAHTGSFNLFDKLKDFDLADAEELEVIMSKHSFLNIFNNGAAMRLNYQTAEHRQGGFEIKAICEDLKKFNLQINLDKINAVAEKDKYDAASIEYISDYFKAQNK